MALVTALALASLVVAPVPKELPKPESVEGEWRVVQILQGGMPGDAGMPVTLVIKGDTMTVKEGKRDDVFALTLDPKATPATFDFREMRGGKPGDLLSGIYLLEKDKLTICFSADGGERPKEFRSEVGSKTGLLVLERVKK